MKTYMLPKDATLETLFLISKVHFSYTNWKYILDESSAYDSFKKPQATTQASTVCTSDISF